MPEDTLFFIHLSFFPENSNKMNDKIWEMYHYDIVFWKIDTKENEALLWHIWDVLQKNIKYHNLGKQVILLYICKIDLGSELYL